MATGRPEALERLLCPYPVDEFFSQFWTVEPLHISSCENPALQELYRELIADDVERLLTSSAGGQAPVRESIELRRDGVTVPVEQYLYPAGGARTDVDVGRVLGLHRDGASIILHSVHLTLAPVGALCRVVSQFVGVRVHANVYIGPRGARTLPRHSDPHDVFLLQVAGRKDWTLYPSPASPPAALSPDGQWREPRDEGMRVCLGSGELLYIPRGLQHEGVTSGDVSVHLTIGMSDYTWSQLFRDLGAAYEAAGLPRRESNQRPLPMQGGERVPEASPSRS